MRRAVYLWAAAQALFWTSWWVGYAWLPEGVLRGRSLAAHLPLEALPFWPRLAGVVAWNGLYAAVIAACNRIRWVRWPLGWVAALTAWVHYGLLVGTNSFMVPMAERAAPSLRPVLGWPGFYELTAYVLAAAATAGWARWWQRGWLTGPTVPLTPRPLGRQEYALLGAAAVLILTGAALEVARWCRVAGGC